MAAKQKTNTTHSSVDSLINQIGELADPCVHCGFCNATCPSYKILGNELDGPRGRIQQIIDLSTGVVNDPVIRQHLDSCLTCRNCETTCPSSVRFGKIISLGRQLLSCKKYNRAFTQRFVLWWLGRLANKPEIAAFLLQFGAFFRFLLPGRVAKYLPASTRKLPVIAPDSVIKKVAFLGGCLQPGLTPNTNRAMQNLLARLNIDVIPLNVNTCCGALAHHNDAHNKAIVQAQKIIDSFLSMQQATGVEALVMTSSACILELKEYPYLLRDNREYKVKAERFAACVYDVSEMLDDRQITALGINADARLAFHPPCTMQHGQGLEKVEAIENLFRLCGFTLVDITDRHLCCGSAGTYSMTHPHIANQLRDDKLAKMQADKPDYLATANVGCQFFLQQGADENKVWHWLELLEFFANKKQPKY